MLSRRLAAFRLVTSVLLKCKPSATIAADSLGKPQPQSAGIDHFWVVESSTTTSSCLAGKQAALWKKSVRSCKSAISHPSIIFSSGCTLEQAKLEAFKIEHTRKCDSCGDRQRFPLSKRRLGKKCRDTTPSETLTGKCHRIGTFGWPDFFSLSPMQVQSATGRRIGSGAAIVLPGCAPCAKRQEVVMSERRFFLGGSFTSSVDYLK